MTKQLDAKIHKRAIDLSDYLDSRPDFNRDQRIAACRDWLRRENNLGRMSGWNKAKAQ